MDATQLVALGYFSTIAFAATVEATLPLRRPAPGALRHRWRANIALALIDTAVIRLLVPIGILEVAAFAADSRFALLPALGIVPWWLAAVLTFLALDFGKYLQHLALHRLGWAWRFHAVHHSDRDYDFTTGLRFHPVEALLTVSLDLAIIAALGGPLEVVLGYEIARITLSLLAHANFAMPDSVDRVLRLVLVTPNAHRLHHAVEFQARDCNFGTVFTWWDRIGGSWESLPVRSLPDLAIGLPNHRNGAPEGLMAVLLAPFRRAAVERRPEAA